MRKGFLIYEEMRKYFPIYCMYEKAVSHNCSILNFLIYEENFSFFFIRYISLFNYTIYML
jgi:hypothetical protein